MLMNHSFHHTRVINQVQITSLPCTKETFNLIYHKLQYSNYFHTTIIQNIKHKSASDSRNICNCNGIQEYIIKSNKSQLKRFAKLLVPTILVDQYNFKILYLICDLQLITDQLLKPRHFFYSQDLEFDTIFNNFRDNQLINNENCLFNLITSSDSTSKNTSSFYSDQLNKKITIPTIQINDHECKEYCESTKNQNNNYVLKKFKTNENVKLNICKQRNSNNNECINNQSYYRHKPQDHLNNSSFIRQNYAPNQFNSVKTSVGIPNLSHYTNYSKRPTFHWDRKSLENVLTKPKNSLGNKTSSSSIHTDVTHGITEHLNNVIIDDNDRDLENVDTITVRDSQGYWKTFIDYNVTDNIKKPSIQSKSSRLSNPNTTVQLPPKTTNTNPTNVCSANTLTKAILNQESNSMETLMNVLNKKICNDDLNNCLRLSMRAEHIIKKPNSDIIDPENNSLTISSEVQAEWECSNSGDDKNNLNEFINLEKNYAPNNQMNSTIVPNNDHKNSVSFVDPCLNKSIKQNSSNREIQTDNNFYFRENGYERTLMSPNPLCSCKTDLTQQFNNEIGINTDRYVNSNQASFYYYEDSDKRVICSPNDFLSHKATQTMNLNGNDVNQIGNWLSHKTLSQQKESMQNNYDPSIHYTQRSLPPSSYHDQSRYFHSYPSAYHQDDRMTQQFASSPSHHQTRKSHHLSPSINNYNPKISQQNQSIPSSLNYYERLNHLASQNNIVENQTNFNSVEYDDAATQSSNDDDYYYAESYRNSPIIFYNCMTNNSNNYSTLQRNCFMSLLERSELNYTDTMNKSSYKKKLKPSKLASLKKPVKSSDKDKTFSNNKNTRKPVIRVGQYQQNVMGNFNNIITKLYKKADKFKGDQDTQSTTKQLKVKQKPPRTKTNHYNTTPCKYITNSTDSTINGSLRSFTSEINNDAWNDDLTVEDQPSIYFTHVYNLQTEYEATEITELMLIDK